MSVILKYNRRFGYIKESVFGESWTDASSIALLARFGYGVEMATKLQVDYRPIPLPCIRTEGPHYLASGQNYRQFYYEDGLESYEIVTNISRIHSFGLLSYILGNTYAAGTTPGYYIHYISKVTENTPDPYSFSLYEEQRWAHGSTTYVDRSLYRGCLLASVTYDQNMKNSAIKCSTLIYGAKKIDSAITPTNLGNIVTSPYDGRLTQLWGMECSNYQYDSGSATTTFVMSKFLILISSKFTMRMGVSLYQWNKSHPSVKVVGLMTGRLDIEFAIVETASEILTAEVYKWLMDILRGPGITKSTELAITLHYKSVDSNIYTEVKFRDLWLAEKTEGPIQGENNLVYYRLHYGFSSPEVTSVEPINSPTWATGA